MNALDTALRQRFVLAEQEGKCFHAATDVDRHRVQTRVKRRTVINVHTALYARAVYWNRLTVCQRHMHILRTLQDMHPDWVFCGGSAAAVWGFPVAHEHITKVNLMVRNAGKKERARVIRHETATYDFTVRRGVNVTSLDRTVFDCLKDLDAPSALAIADAALRQGVATKSELAYAFERHAVRKSDARRCADLLAHANARSESGALSFTRGVLLQAGYMSPSLRVLVRDPGRYTHGGLVDYRWRLASGVQIYGQLYGPVSCFDDWKRADPPRTLNLADSNPITNHGVRIMRVPFGMVRENPAAFISLLDRYGVPKAV